MFQQLFSLIYKLIGWRIVGTIPDCPKFVLIGAPHTSNWDFVIAILAKYGLGLDTKYLGQAYIILH